MPLIQYILDSIPCACPSQHLTQFAKMVSITVSHKGLLKKPLMGLAEPKALISLYLGFGMAEAKFLETLK